MAALIKFSAQHTVCAMPAAGNGPPHGQAWVLCLRTSRNCFRMRLSNVLLSHQAVRVSLSFSPSGDTRFHIYTSFNRTLEKDLLDI